MYALSWFFLKVVLARLLPEAVSSGYLAGAVLLGAAPCTASVFVWSYLTRGDGGDTLIQMAINDLVLIFAYAPIVVLLPAIGDASVPADTVLLSVGLFVVVPLAAGWLSRVLLIKRRGREWFEDVFTKPVGKITPTACS